MYAFKIAAKLLHLILILTDISCNFPIFTQYSTIKTHCLLFTQPENRISIEIRARDQKKNQFNCLKITILAALNKNRKIF